MICSNSIDQSKNEDWIDEKNCEYMLSMDDYFKVKDQFEYILHQHQSLKQKVKLLKSSLLSNSLLDLREEIDQLEIKSNEIEKSEYIIEQQLKDFIDQNKESIRMRNNSFENCIQQLMKDIQQFKFQFEQIDNLLNPVTQQIDQNNKFCYLLMDQINPSIKDINQYQTYITETENEIYSDDEQFLENIYSDTTPTINRKIHLANKTINRLRGSCQIIIDAPMRLVELCTQEKHLNEKIKQALQQQLIKQKETNLEEQTKNNSFQFVFSEITSNWTFESKNWERGFSSPSIWMRNPLNQRILVKRQDHPLSAANEWLAYVLGREIGLPINQVQIGIYQNNLVSLHTDVNQDNNKIITFINLPTKLKKRLLIHPIMESMDLFDHIILNVDRNPNNILITLSNTTNIQDPEAKLKIHFIDHSSSFGMGKLNLISAIACKLHTQHLAVVKFDPIDQATKFERYLINIPITDRHFIQKTLNYFSKISNQQIDYWMEQVKQLLSSTQYNRIRTLLYRQRDIAARYIIQWGQIIHHNQNKLHFK